jgi:hypothetical protein
MFSSGGYGRFGGHGRGRGGYSAARQGGQGWLSKPKVPRAPSPSLGLVLTTILYNELNEDQEPPSNAKITGVEDVASYNWVKANEPTIMIPGWCSYSMSSNKSKIILT